MGRSLEPVSHAQAGTTCPMESVIKCSDNCVTCTNSDQCTSCIHGKYLNDSTCIPCPVECGGVIAMGSDGSCLSWSQRDFNWSMVCAFVWLEHIGTSRLPNVSHVRQSVLRLAIRSVDIVHVKRGQFRNTTTGLCQPCPAECSVECGTFTGACESCPSGYYLSNGVCIKCSD